MTTNLQNVISLVLSDDQVRNIHAALTTLETAVPGLISLSQDQKRAMTKMGERSAEFCRNSLELLTQNPQLLPPNINLADGIADLKTSDQLRPVIVRLSQIFQRLQDTDFALRSDAMSLALRGYQLLKVNGRGAGLESLQRALRTRFSKKRRAVVTETPPAAAA